MGAILEQLGIDRTLFIQFAVFLFLFVTIGNIFFKPFQKLFELRYKRTVQDKDTALRLTAQAEAKFEEYKRRLNEERLAARKEYERLLSEAKKEESVILANARAESKKITQAATEAIQAQRDLIKKQLENDVEAIAKTISETLLTR